MRFPKWPGEDPAIAEMLGRTRFVDVYKYMFDNCVPYRIGANLFKERVGVYERIIRSGRDKGITDLHHYIFFIADYRMMSIRLEMSESTSKKYIKMMYRTWIEPGGGKRVKRGSRECYVYAIGYWLPSIRHEGWRAKKKISFMCDKTKRKVIKGHLRIFKVRQ